MAVYSFYLSNTWRHGVLKVNRGHPPPSESPTDMDHLPLWKPRRPSWREDIFHFGWGDEPARQPDNVYLMNTFTTEMRSRKWWTEKQSDGDNGKGRAVPVLLSRIQSSCLSYTLELAFIRKEAELANHRVSGTAVFNVVLFTIAKIWNQPRGPTAGEWQKKIQFLYTLNFW